MDATISHKRLVEIVEALPEFDLQAVQLMRAGFQPQSDDDLQVFADATAQIIQYGERCEKAVTSLRGLNPTPVRDPALVQEFPL